MTKVWWGIPEKYFYHQSDPFHQQLFWHFWDRFKVKYYSKEISNKRQTYLSKFQTFLKDNMIENHI